MAKTKKKKKKKPAPKDSFSKAKKKFMRISQEAKIPAKYYPIERVQINEANTRQSLIVFNGVYSPEHFSSVQFRLGIKPKPGAQVLVLGDGTGIGAITAVKRGAEQAVVTDKGGRECANIYYNIQQFNLGSAITLERGDLFGIPSIEENAYHHIYMNPPMLGAGDDDLKILKNLLEQGKDYLAPGGTLEITYLEYPLFFKEVYAADWEPIFIQGVNTSLEQRGPRVDYLYYVLIPHVGQETWWQELKQDWEVLYDFYWKNFRETTTFNPSLEDQNKLLSLKEKYQPRREEFNAALILRNIECLLTNDYVKVPDVRLNDKYSELVNHRLSSQTKKSSQSRLIQNFIGVALLLCLLPSLSLAVPRAYYKYEYKPAIRLEKGEYFSNSAQRQIEKAVKLSLLPKELRESLKELDFFIDTFLNIIKESSQLLEIYLVIDKASLVGDSKELISKISKMKQEIQTTLDNKDISFLEITNIEILLSRRNKEFMQALVDKISNIYAWVGGIKNMTFEMPNLVSELYGELLGKKIEKHISQTAVCQVEAKKLRAQIYELQEKFYRVLNIKTSDLLFVSERVYQVLDLIKKQDKSDAKIKKDLILAQAIVLSLAELIQDIEKVIEMQKRPPTLTTTNTYKVVKKWEQHIGSKFSEWSIALLIAPFYESNLKWLLHPIKFWQAHQVENKLDKYSRIFGIIILYLALVGGLLIDTNITWLNFAIHLGPIKLFPWQAYISLVLAHIGFNVMVKLIYPLVTIKTKSSFNSRRLNRNFISAA